MPNGKPWTPEADDALRNAVIAGASLTAMTEALGRSKSSIKARAYILRISLRPALQLERLQGSSDSLLPDGTELGGGQKPNDNQEIAGSGGTSSGPFRGRSQTSSRIRPPGRT